MELFEYKKEKKSFFDKRIFYALGRVFRSIKSWFKYHFNKNFFHVLKTAWKGYPWDYAFLYMLEKAKLEEMIAYHSKVKRYIGVEEDIKWMKLCCKLIDIFLEEKELYHYDGEMKFNKIDENGEDLFELDGSDLKYVCHVKVNTKNAERFVPKQVMSFYMERPHELYVLKAKYLYHKIRFEKDEHWWD